MAEGYRVAAYGTIICREQMMSAQGEGETGKVEKLAWAMA